jgi:hypothetical protein
MCEYHVKENCVPSRTQSSYKFNCFVVSASASSIYIVAGLTEVAFPVWLVDFQGGEDLDFSDTM